MFVGGAVEYQEGGAWLAGNFPVWAAELPRALGMVDGHDLGGASLPSDLRAWLHRFAAAFGFSGARYTHIGHSLGEGRQSERPPLRFLSSLGEEADPWRAGDPSAQQAIRGLLPFGWNTKDNLELPDEHRSWLSVERVRGVAAGIAIPVQDYLSGPAYLTLLGRAADDIAALMRLEAQALLFHAIGFHGSAKDIIPPSTAPADPLTDKELACLRLAAAGAKPLEAARYLGIGKRTVELHFENIVSKLGAANRVHAVAIALSSGLIQI
ncbi:MAG: autoinducer binding domain-containing protein [Sphingobium sp.]|nr:autoinducer binding domain-containing protein [Sphingobium sp.]